MKKIGHIFFEIISGRRESNPTIRNRCLEVVIIDTDVLFVALRIFTRVTRRGLDGFRLQPGPWNLEFVA